MDKIVGGMILVDLQRKIDRIEDYDSDFAKNKKWQKLRRQQEVIYVELRRGNGMDM